MIVENFSLLTPQQLGERLREDISERANDNITAEQYKDYLEAQRWREDCLPW